MTLFLLRSLPLQDDEVRSIHLPIVFAAITDRLQVLWQLLGYDTEVDPHYSVKSAKTRARLPNPLSENV